MRRCRPLAALSLAALLAALPACADDADERQPGPRSLDGFDSDPAVVLRVDADGFEPTTVTVEARELVEVRNVGDEPHSAESGPEIDTGTLLPGESTVLVFDEVGTVELHDGEAPDHEVTIEVTAGR